MVELNGPGLGPRGVCGADPQNVPRQAPVVDVAGHDRAAPRKESEANRLTDEPARTRVDEGPEQVPVR